MYHVGGPELLSRVDIANLVSKRLGMGKTHEEQAQLADSIVRVSRSSVACGYASPLSVAMTSKALEKKCGLSLQPARVVLKRVFPGER